MANNIFLHCSMHTNTLPLLVAWPTIKFTAPPPWFRPRTTSLVHLHRIAITWTMAFKYCREDGKTLLKFLLPLLVAWPTTSFTAPSPWFRSRTTSLVHLLRITITRTMAI